MQVIMPHKEVVSEGAGLPARTGEVLRIPYRQIRLTRERIFSEMVDKIIVVSIAIPYASRSSLLIFQVVRPEPLLIRMGKSARLRSMCVSRITPRPDLPRLTGIGPVPSDPF